MAAVNRSVGRNFGRTDFTRDGGVGGAKKSPALHFDRGRIGSEKEK
jgi:hypothetical protein